jgi:hypothetical protein
MKTQTTRRSISVVTLLALLTSLMAVVLVRYAAAEGKPASLAPPAGGDAVTVWNANAGVAATAACVAPLNNPLHESRIYAMMHVAIHDALNAIDRRSRPYAFDVQAEAGASPDAAVAAAARDVLVKLIAGLPLELHTQACIDAGVASAEAAYAAALAAIPGYCGGTGRCRRYPRPEGGRRRGWSISEFRVPAGYQSRRVSMHTGYAVHRL